MILILIPVAGIVLGVGLWVALRGLGALNMPGSEPGPSRPERRERPMPTATTSYYYGESSSGFRGWLDNIPQWALLTVIGLSGVWILGWLIVLIIGLSMLS